MRWSDTTNVWTSLAAVRTLCRFDMKQKCGCICNFDVHFLCSAEAKQIHFYFGAESCCSGRMWEVQAACVKFQMIDSNMLCALCRSPSFLPWGRNVLSLPRSWPTNKETDFAALATSTTHNQSLAFSLVLSPKRRPSQTTSIILLWFLSSLVFFFSSSPFHFSFPLLLGKFHSGLLRGPLPDRWGFVW